jgi:hypothetical protein
VKLRMTFNLGHRDARRLGVEGSHEGDVVTVSRAAGDEMLSRSWAVEVQSEPDKIRAVPSVDIEATAKGRKGNHAAK